MALCAQHAMSYGFKPRYSSVYDTEFVVCSTARTWGCLSFYYTFKSSSFAARINEPCYKLLNEFAQWYPRILDFRAGVDIWEARVFWRSRWNFCYQFSNSSVSRDTGNVTLRWDSEMLFQLPSVVLLLSIFRHWRGSRNSCSSIWIYCYATAV